MRDPRITFRSRGFAALLAFLLPGAGHFYQGRRVKAGVFSLCILSTFFAGMVLGEWQPVYSQVVHGSGRIAESAQLSRTTPATERSLGYFAQVFVGLPALPSLVQSARCTSPQNIVQEVLNGPLDTEFRGGIRDTGQRNFLPVAGRLHVEPNRGKTMSGTFTGTDEKTGEPVTLELQGQASLGRPVFGSPHRQASFDLASDDRLLNGRLEGTIPRPLHNWFQAPRDNTELDRLHGVLSQRYDVGCVFTWIAGLLNLMVIWDAFDGPAYGYGDEEEDDDENKDD